MKKALRVNQFAILLIGLLASFVSCEPKAKDNTNGQSERKGGVERKIDENIKLLSKELDWERAQELYEKTKSDIGNKQYNLKSRVQNDLYSLADKAFCHSMDTLMFVIMSGECKPRHKELFAVHKIRSETDEFSKVAPTPLHTQVEAMFSEHQNMRDIVLPGLRKSKQKIDSYETPYETKYEKDAINNANTYLAKNPKCLEIKDGLTRVKEGKYFNGWRVSYCQAVVDSYCETFSDSTHPWAQKYENITKGNIGFYTEEHESDSIVLAWMQRIAEIKIIHQ